MTSMIPQLPTPATPPSTAAALVNVPVGMGVPVSGMSPMDYWAHLGGLTFNCVDQLGIQWFFSDPVGWADGTTVTITKQKRGKQHGAWIGTSFLEERIISFTGRVIAPTPTLAWQARNALLGVAASLANLTGDMNVDTKFGVNEPDAYKYAYVRVSDRCDVVWVDSTAFQFTIPLLAHDPRKYGAAYSSTVGLPVASGGLGPYPLAFPVTFGGTGLSGSVAAANGGNFVATPILTVTGPCSGPVIYDQTTNQQIQLDIVLGSSDYVVIDTDKLSVTLNGTAGRDNTVVPGSVFPVMPPGVTVFQFGASSYSSSARLTVAWDDVWW